FFFSSRRRHTRWPRDWSSDVCSSDLVSKGVKPELVKLVGLEGVGRVRARMMYSAGLKNIDDIKERSLTELTVIPTIGPSLAKRIKEQAGGLIKAEEWEKAKSIKPADVEQQIMLTEYEDTE